MSKLAPLRGMKDLLPDDFRIHQYIEKIALNTAKLYGYEGFTTPLLEYVSVFDRTLGDSSDVVSKEMYSLSFVGFGKTAISLKKPFVSIPTPVSISKSMLKEQFDSSVTTTL